MVYIPFGKLIMSMTSGKAKKKRRRSSRSKEKASGTEIVKPTISSEGKSPTPGTPVKKINPTSDKEDVTIRPSSHALSSNSSGGTQSVTVNEATTGSPGFGAARYESIPSSRSYDVGGYQGWGTPNGSCHRKLPVLRGRSICELDADDGNFTTTMFSDENPNACTIV
ncbi:hypothetical protein H6P81_008949 [Aristolochia fimbriata]|uniref:Uncharacterized protein n=1 Tax=Aristolochia fimbriata TaxID=158543 RepID=A0AAV7EK46_ARIFI|nr:hypothetical protein H6P81_008949 [Aristolochia fimbriata]